MPPHQPSPFARRSRILRLLAFLAASFVSFLAFYSEYATITRRLGHPCRPDARQGSGFESPRRGGGVTTSQRAHAVAKLLVSTGGTRCQVSRPRSPRDQHRVPRLQTYTHSPSTRSPRLSTPLPPLLLAFVRHRAVLMVDFLAREKARPQHQAAPAPARPTSAPLACRWHRHACPSCWARCHRRCGRPRRAHAVVCACARRQVFARPGG